MQGNTQEHREGTHGVEVGAAGDREGGGRGGRFGHGEISIPGIAGCRQSGSVRSVFSGGIRREPRDLERDQRVVSQNAIGLADLKLMVFHFRLAIPAFLWNHDLAYYAHAVRREAA